MTGFRYALGQWWAIAARGTALLLAPDTPPVVVGRMLGELRIGGPIAGVLGVLAETTGSGLLSLPPFALFAPDGAATRLMLRGVDADVDGRRLIGTGVLTWTEHEIASDAVVSLGDGAAEEGLELADGVVRCSILVLGPATEQRSALPARPAIPLTDRDAVVAPAPVVAVRTDAPDAGATLLPAGGEDEGPGVVEQAPEGPTDEPDGSAAQAPVDAPQQDDGVDLTGLTDLLGGHTVVRSIADAARRPGREPDPVPAQAERPVREPDPDHDGFTMLRSELPEDGEVNVRTSIGILRLHDGRMWELDRPVIIGRRPQASRVSAGEVPHLVTVESRTQDISRSHVEIRPEGAHAVVSDLGTTNGTTLRRRGRPPQRLVANDRHVLADGDVVDLGDDVLVTYSSGEASG